MIDLFVLDKIVLKIIQEIVYNPYAQLTALSITLLVTTVAFPEKKVKK